MFQLPCSPRPLCICAHVAVALAQGAAMVQHAIDGCCALHVRRVYALAALAALAAGRLRRQVPSTPSTCMPDPMHSAMPHGDVPIREALPACPPACRHP